MRANFIDGALPGSVGDVSPSGWTHSSLFVNWLVHFVAITKCSKEHPHLIVLDGHHSHKTLEAIEFCRSNGIELLTIPPHSSHKMQPLDCCYFKSLKAAYNSAADNWMISNPGKRMSIYEVARIIGEAYLRTAIPNSGMNGFKITGIWPYNKDIFTEEDFLATELTEEARPSSDVQSSDQETGIRNEVNPVIEYQVDPVNENQVDAQIEDNVVPCSAEIISNIVPKPKLSAKRQRTRKCEKATHLTSTPTKNVLEERDRAKTRKGSKKNSKSSASCSRRIQFAESDSSEDEEWSCLVCGEPFANSRS